MNYAFAKLEVTWLYNWMLSRENLILLHANNKGADQPAHMRRLISAFFIRSLENEKFQYSTSTL